MADSIQFPEKLDFLFQPHRYKVAYGGRGSAKSWSFGRALLTQGAHRPLRVLCAREIQESIEQSVHALLKDQVKRLNLGGFYDVQKNAIRGRNGTEFSFHGLLHNIDNIKSAEGADICWVEEAQKVSRESWTKLVPTIRKDGSEIWVTFNPELEEDETYQRFVIAPPKDSVVVKMNYDDNPWFPKVLEDERLELESKDPDEYLHVWEGHCKQALTGAVYADELRDALQGNRICPVPYDRSKAVHVFADLGWSDFTSLWFIQRVGMQYRVLRAYQNRHKPWSHYLERIQETGYLLDTIWLPHDGAAKQLGTGKSIEELTREAGRKVRIVPKLSALDGINAAREVFPLCWFDEKECADGLRSLRRYVWDDGVAKREPKHDENSHYADGFRYFAVGFKEGRPTDERAAALAKRLNRAKTFSVGRPGGWMGG